MYPKPAVELALLPGAVDIPLNAYPFTLAQLAPGTCVTWATFPKGAREATEVGTTSTIRAVRWDRREAVELRHDILVVSEGRTHFMGMEVLVADASGIAASTLHRT